MNPNEQPLGVHPEFRSKDAVSLETRIGRLRDTVRRRNEQEKKLLEWLSQPGPVEQSAVQDLWLSLLRTIQEVDGETKSLIREKLSFRD